MAGCNEIHLNVHNYAMFLKNWNLQRKGKTKQFLNKKRRQLFRHCTNQNQSVIIHTKRNALIIHMKHFTHSERSKFIQRTGQHFDLRHDDCIYSSGSRALHSWIWFWKFNKTSAILIEILMKSHIHMWTNYGSPYEISKWAMALAIIFKHFSYKYISTARFFRR